MRDWGVLEKYHFNRRWYFLAGIMSFFVYVYVRPFMRGRLGSASRSYISSYSLYVLWLCGAVFYHLPSFNALGIDIRTDLSMLIVVFLCTMMVGRLSHNTADGVRMGVRGQQQSRSGCCPPACSPPTARLKDVALLLAINAMLLAVSCSTYHSFCGNGIAATTPAHDTTMLKHAVCREWLPPILTSQYPKFSAWMIYAHNTTMLKHAVCREWLPPILTSQYPKFSAWMIYGESQGSGIAAPKVHLGNNNTSSLITSYVETLMSGGCNISSGVLDVCMGVYLNGSSGSSRGSSSSSSGSSGGGSSSGNSGGGGSSISCGGVRRERGDVGTGGVHLTPCEAQPVEGERLSPVFTMWITMIMLYLATSLADYVATGSLQATHVAEMRCALEGTNPVRRVSHSARLGSQLGRSSNSTGATLPNTPGGGGARGKATARNRGALELKRPISKTWGQRLVNKTLSTLTRQATTLGSSAAHYLEPGSLVSQLVQHVRTTIARQLSSSSSSSLRDSTQMPPYPAPAHSKHQHQNHHHQQQPHQQQRQQQHSFAGSTGYGATSSSGRPAGGMRHGLSEDGLEEDDFCGTGAGVGKGGEAVAGAQPKFLPMVPWYSGTSADLFITGFDLMVSMKLFLGRFDMRTMQAATASSMADSFNDSTPAEGDGFTYEQYDDRPELWFDFIADTGDGGNPTYTIARALAAPSLTIPVSKGCSQMAEAALAVAAGAGGSSSLDKDGGGVMTLPRGELLLIGGDLAYPNPSQENYEERLFRPFQDALPPPAHYHPGRLVVHKPDLPPVYGVQEATLPGGPRGMSPRTSRHASAAALRSYTGPHCFAIPGNHDWIDGLETFIKHILHKGWLGGWLLPQEKSYFAIRLPHGWWQFGLDLALVGDLDMCQYRYFANLVEQRMQPDDQVIILTHEPLWLTDWFWQRPETEGANLRQLIRGHLRGRARVWFSGDLHFYMRHSFMQSPPPPTSPRPQLPRISNPQPRLLPTPSQLQPPLLHPSSPRLQPPLPVRWDKPCAQLLLLLLLLLLLQRLQARRADSQLGCGSNSRSCAPSGALPDPTPAAAAAAAAAATTYCPAGPSSAKQLCAPFPGSNDSSPASSAPLITFTPTAVGTLRLSAAGCGPPTHDRQPGSPCFSAAHPTSQHLHDVLLSQVPLAVTTGVAAAAAHDLRPGTSVPIASSGRQHVGHAFNGCRPERPVPVPMLQTEHIIPPRLFEASGSVVVETPRFEPRVSSLTHSSPTALTRARVPAQQQQQQQQSLTLSPTALSRAMMPSSQQNGGGLRYPYLGGGGAGCLDPVPGSAAGWRPPTTAAIIAAAAADGCSIAGGSSIVGGSSDDEDALSDGGFSILSGTSNCYSHWPGHPGSSAAVPMLSSGGIPVAGALQSSAGYLYGSSPGGASNCSVGRHGRTAGGGNSSGQHGSGSRRHGRDGMGSKHGSVRNLRVLRHLPGLRLDAPEGVTFGSEKGGGSVRIETVTAAGTGGGPAQRRSAVGVNAAVSNLCQSCQEVQRTRCCNFTVDLYPPSASLVTEPSKPSKPPSTLHTPLNPPAPLNPPTPPTLSTPLHPLKPWPLSHTRASQVRLRDNHHMHDPDHLICNGAGGAFLHPTHIFAPARFSLPLDSAAEATASLYKKSLEIGRRNVHVFRSKNTRFDVIGGVFYFLLIVSVIPRCSPIAAVVDAATAGEAAALLASAFFDTLLAIFSTSYVSLGAVLLMFGITLGLAKAGGAGLLTSPSKHGPVPHARSGGLPTQLLLAFAHTATHVSLAVLLMLLLELGVETCIRHEHLGEEGYHSLYRWYRSYEAEHFPDPMGLRNTLQAWTLGLYPQGLKYCMALFDIPEAIAVTRASMCARAGGVSHLTRIQAVAYYMGMLAYYWLLATPAMGFVLGIYLYVSVCVLRIHYDEAFSALRVPNFKALTRCHINRDGDLELFTLAIDKVPNTWREDPRWRGARGAGTPRWPHTWQPSQAGGCPSWTSNAPCAPTHTTTITHHDVVGVSQTLASVCKTDGVPDDRQWGGAPDHQSGGAIPDDDELDAWPERASSSSSSSRRPAVTKPGKKPDPAHQRWNPLRPRGPRAPPADVEFKLVDYLKVTARRYPDPASL
ncbi:MAG: hypothetical protein WDW38_011542 [Sanguina aurantia]